MCTYCATKLINTPHYVVSFMSYCLDQAILSATVTFSHFCHYSRAMLVILYHPNVCSTLVKTPKQTFISPYCKSHTEPVLLDLCPVTPHPSNSHLWDPVTLFSFLPTALTAWIKSTVTCVTTSPILLQT